MKWNLIIPTLGVVGGWAVGQLWPVLKNWLYRNWVKKNIVVEVGQLGEELERVELIYRRALQLTAHKRIEPGPALPISTAIYSNHYKDAVFVFTSTQRVALQMIYAYIDQINAQSKKLEEMAETALEHMFSDTLSEQDFLKWDDKLRGTLTAIALAKWHIAHYIEHRDFPALEINTETHQRFLEYCSEIPKHHERIVEGARSIPIEKFGHSMFKN